MATTSVKKKDTLDSLLERFGKAIDSGAAKMDTEQLRKSEKKFNEAIDRAVANKQRRETA